MANFVKHEKCPECGSSNNLAIYDDGSYYCFSHCGYKSLSKEYKDEIKQEKPSKVRAFSIPEEQREKERKLSKEIITDEEHEKIKEIAGFDVEEYRGIRADTFRYFGVRTQLSTEDEVQAQYYPCTVNGELTGYKKRIHPKTFSTAAGITGKDCDLFGAHRFKTGGKYVAIVGGELDSMTLFQVLSDYNKNRGSEFIIAVVSPTVGETGCAKQLAVNYEFLNSFENILVGFDNDEAGREATEKIISSLPKNKIKIITWTKGKDPNEMLQKGFEKQIISDFYNAKTYIPVGVTGSSELYDQLLSQTMQPRLPFPPIFRRLNEMVRGGMPTGHIITINAATSIGKTSYVDTIVHYWIMNSSYKVGTVSLEGTNVQYAESMLSRHIGKKIVNFTSDEQKLEFIKREEVKVMADELFKDSEGNDRFVILDDRDGSVADIQNKIEQMVISSGCKIIVIDPTNDLIGFLPLDEQERFNAWCKSMIKSHGIIIVLVNHLRKSIAGQKDGSRGAKPSESDIMGSGSTAKSSSLTIMLSRDKLNEDPIIRNTTEIEIPKNRVFSDTGPADAIYYDSDTHQLVNFEDKFGMTFKEYVESKESK